MSEINQDYDETVGFRLPNRSKCYLCNHVFTEVEIRWASPFMETLCDECHSKTIQMK